MQALELNNQKPKNKLFNDLIREKMEWTSESENKDANDKLAFNV